ncbi:MAG: hypothetical protein R3Y56_05055 [Akkermansia sp.]
MSITEFGLNQEGRDVRITVSLTSFPARMNTVHLTVQTLLMQSVKPDRVVLWLAEEQFPNKEGDLTESLLRLKEFGLSIEWTHDTRSYKKLIPSLKKYPDDIIITADDDIYYESDTVEKLYQAYVQNPSQIYAHRIWRIVKKGDALSIVKKKKMYGMWQDLYPASFLNYQLGYGTVLYPPHCLNEAVLDEANFTSLVPTQDDIYFWAMAVLNGTKIAGVKGYHFHSSTIENTQNSGLCKINNASGDGMSALQAIEIMMNHYPELKSRVSEVLKEA